MKRPSWVADDYQVVVRFRTHNGEVIGYRSKVTQDFLYGSDENMHRYLALKAFKANGGVQESLASYRVGVADDRGPTVKIEPLMPWSDVLE